jgi:BirA family biotin operon repressor/biotin-[acetyl-CoA-carboxylase] ligase
MISVGAERLTAEAVLAELGTSWMGRSLRVLGTTTSTIDEAKAWLRDGAPNGATVMAERQTAGRGRRGRTWASPVGGLWMSVVAHPQIPIEAAGRLGALTALAAAECVSEETSTEVEIKWPNDLVIGGRKAGGVLVETETSAASVTAAVLSVGLNVNFPMSELPAEARASATTLLEETGRVHSLGELAARLLEGLEQAWPAVRGEVRSLRARWRRRDALAAREVMVEVAGKTISGRAAGIDQQGRLKLAVRGRECRIPAAEAVRVREAQQ